MARIDGVQDLMVELTELASIVDSDEIVEVAKKSWDVVRDQIDSNARANGFYDTGLLLDPRTILTNAGVSTRGDKKVIFAEAGAFKSDTAMSDYGFDPKKDMPRGMVAYWLEFGTQDHYITKGTRARKTPITEGINAAMTKGIAPSKFISSAYDTKNEEAFKKLQVGLGELIDKAIRR